MSRAAGLFCSLLLILTTAAQAGQIELVDQLPAGSRSDTASGTSVPLQLSMDGRYLLFVSDAANLVPGQRDENRGNDLFLFDRTTGVKTLVTHKAGAANTAAGISLGQYPDGKLSPDGRWVAFGSPATDLVAGQQGPAGWNLFLWDRTTGATTLVSHKAGAPLVTASGYSAGFQITTGGSLAFASNAADLIPNQNDATGNYDVFFWDRVSGKTTLVSRTPKSATTSGNGESTSPWVSGDGRWIAFETQATNLLPGAPLPTPLQYVLLHDRSTGKSLLVSHASRGASTAPQGYSSGPIVSTGGTWVLFGSNATDLVAGQQDRPATDDLFLFERATGKITLVSHASASPAKAVGDVRGYRMTPDGAWIAFTSGAVDLVAGQTEVGGPSADVFLYERATGRNRLASRAAASPLTAADSDSLLSGLSADGRWVTFSTGAYNMLPNAGADTNQAADAFVFDRVTGQASLLSAASPGKPGNDGSTGPVISAEGGWIAYATYATDLVPGKKDLNALSDVVLAERATAKARLVSLHPPPLPSLTPTAFSRAEGVSADGRWSVFTSGATNLVPGQQDGNNGYDDVFLYDHLLHTITLVSRAAGSATAGGNGKAFLPRISADGRFVIYLSESSNAVPGQIDPNNESPGAPYDADLFLFDRITETTVLVSHAAGSPTTTANQECREPAAISADGRWIVFSTFATDVAGQVDPSGRSSHTYLYDRVTGQNSLLDHAYGAPDQAADEGSEPAGLSADGNVVLLLSGARNLTTETFFDTNSNAWVLDRTTGLFTLTSRAATPAFPQAGADDATLSADGGTVAFFSRRANVVPGQTGEEDNNLFLWDRLSGVTRLVSHTAGSATAATTALTPAALSADGRWVVFASYGRDLVPGETDTNQGADLYLYDRDTGTHQLVSHALGSATTTGALPVNGQTLSISADGRFVPFVDRSSNLVAGPAAPQPQDNLFLFDRATGVNTLVSRSWLAPDRPAHGGTDNYVLGAGGTALLFTSYAWDLVPGDYTINLIDQSLPDVFLYTLP